MMKRNLLTWAFALLWCIVGQGQNPSSTEVNIQELNASQTKFTRLSEKKQYPQAVQEGIHLSTLLTQNRQYKEAFAVCRQMDDLIYAGEKESGKPDYALRASR